MNCSKMAALARMVAPAELEKLFCIRPLPSYISRLRTSCDTDISPPPTANHLVKGSALLTVKSKDQTTLPSLKILQGSRLPS
ncbi:hypothetical protein IMZ48_28655 [Candidatus Bathyarchaeota archaeon]|nr:hypothetical protein [Candidatus Bathyarchaeota archaeon]